MVLIKNTEKGRGREEGVEKKDGKHRSENKKKKSNGMIKKQAQPNRAEKVGHSGKCFEQRSTRSCFWRNNVVEENQESNPCNDETSKCCKNTTKSNGRNLRSKDRVHKNIEEGTVKSGSFGKSLCLESGQPVSKVTEDGRKMSAIKKIFMRKEKTGSHKMSTSKKHNNVKYNKLDNVKHQASRQSKKDRSITPTRQSQRKPDSKLRKSGDSHLISPITLRLTKLTPKDGLDVKNEHLRDYKFGTYKSTILKNKPHKIEPIKRKYDEIDDEDSHSSTFGTCKSKILKNKLLKTEPKKRKYDEIDYKDSHLSTLGACKSKILKNKLHKTEPKKRKYDEIDDEDSHSSTFGACKSKILKNKLLKTEPTRRKYDEIDDKDSHLSTFGTFKSKLLKNKLHKTEPTKRKCDEIDDKDSLLSTFGTRKSKILKNKLHKTEPTKRKYDEIDDKDSHLSTFGTSKSKILKNKHHKTEPTKRKFDETGEKQSSNPKKYKRSNTSATEETSCKSHTSNTPSTYKESNREMVINEMEPKKIHNDECDDIWVIGHLTSLNTLRSSETNDTSRLLRMNFQSNQSKESRIRTWINNVEKSVKMLNALDMQPCKPPQPLKYNAPVRNNSNISKIEIKYVKESNEQNNIRSKKSIEIARKPKNGANVNQDILKSIRISSKKLTKISNDAGSSGKGVTTKIRCTTEMKYNKLKDSSDSDSHSTKPTPKTRRNKTDLNSTPARGKDRRATIGPCNKIPFVKLTDIFSSRNINNEENINRASVEGSNQKITKSVSNNHHCENLSNYKIPKVKLGSNSALDDSKSDCKMKSSNGLKAQCSKIGVQNVPLNRIKECSDPNVEQKFDNKSEKMIKSKMLVNREIKEKPTETICKTHKNSKKATRNNNGVRIVRSHKTTAKKINIDEEISSENVSKHTRNTKLSQGKKPLLTDYQVKNYAKKEKEFSKHLIETSSETPSLKVSIKLSALDPNFIRNHNTTSYFNKSSNKELEKRLDYKKNTVKNMSDYSKSEIQTISEYEKLQNKNPSLNDSSSMNLISSNINDKTHMTLHPPPLPTLLNSLYTDHNPTPSSHSPVYSLAPLNSPKTHQEPALATHSPSLSPSPYNPPYIDQEPLPTTHSLSRSPSPLNPPDADQEPTLVIHSPSKSQILLHPPDTSLKSNPLFSPLFHSSTILNPLETDLELIPTCINKINTTDTPVVTKTGKDKCIDELIIGEESSYPNTLKNINGASETRDPQLFSGEVNSNPCVDSQSRIVQDKFETVGRSNVDSNDSLYICSLSDLNDMDQSKSTSTSILEGLSQCNSDTHGGQLKNCVSVIKAIKDVYVTKEINNESTDRTGGIVRPKTVGRKIKPRSYQITHQSSVDRTNINLNWYIKPYSENCGDNSSFKQKVQNFYLPGNHSNFKDDTEFSSSFATPLSTNDDEIQIVFSNILKPYGNKWQTFEQPWASSKWQTFGQTWASSKWKAFEQPWVSSKSNLPFLNENPTNQLVYCESKSRATTTQIIDLTEDNDSQDSTSTPLLNSFSNIDSTEIVFKQIKQKSGSSEYPFTTIALIKQRQLNAEKYCNCRIMRGANVITDLTTNTVKHNEPDQFSVFSPITTTSLGSHEISMYRKNKNWGNRQFYSVFEEDIEKTNPGVLIYKNNNSTDLMKNYTSTRYFNLPRFNLESTEKEYVSTADHYGLEVVVNALNNLQLDDAGNRASEDKKKDDCKNDGNCKTRPEDDRKSASKLVSIFDEDTVLYKPSCV